MLFIFWKGGENVRITKDMLLLQISKEDDKLLDFVHSDPKIDPRKLTVKELTELLEAFKTMYELFRKCSVKRR